MDAHKKIREHISALSDGELATNDLELATAALRSADGELAWATYHRIGDVLRGQQAPDFSAGFDERLAARLASEPPLARRAATPAATGSGAPLADSPLAGTGAPTVGASLSADGAASVVSTTP